MITWANFDRVTLNNPTNMKIVRYFLVLILYCHLPLQAQESKHKLVQAISELDAQLVKIFSGGNSHFFVSMNGLVEEWDTIMKYKISYDIRDIDLSTIQIKELPESNEASLVLQCKNQNNCIRYEHEQNKTRYLTQVFAFTLPIENKSELTRLFQLLTNIQSTLPR